MSRIVIVILIYHRHKLIDLMSLYTESDTESIIKLCNKHELCIYVVLIRATEPGLIRHN
jgi:hypothetical protein